MRLPGFLLRYSEFIGHVATMMSGKTVAAAIALFTMPIIARLFEPGDFGVAAVFMSTVGIASNIASLRYERAFVLPKQEHEALTLMALAYRILLVFCVAMLVMICIYAVIGASWSVPELLGTWMWLLPLGVVLMAALQIQESWLTRKKAFKLVSASLIVGNSVTSASRIAFGALVGTSIYGLIIGNLLGTACRLVIQKTASRQGLQTTFSHIGWPAMRQIAHRYADFPKLNAPAGLVFSLGQNLPVLLFGVLFTPAVAGLYAMANRLAQVPVTIVATAMRRVFLQKAAATNNSGRSLHKAFLLVTGGLALLGAIPFTCLSLFGQPLSIWLLGERWLTAGRFLEIIAPWMFMIWVTAPSNPIFVVLRRQKLWLLVQTILTLLRLGAFGLAFVIAAGPEWTLQAFVMVTVVGNIVTILMAFMLISQRVTERPDPIAHKL